MSKEDIDLPVSLEFFMKCTHYEEMVKKILRAKSHGDAQRLQQFLNSESVKQKALRNYYRAFYLEPETRRKFPIRFKPMPKKQKDKLLQYPKSKTSDKGDVEGRNDCVIVGSEELFSLGRGVKRFEAVKLMKQSDNDELMAEDDDEPLGGEDEVPITSTKQNSPRSILTPKATKRSVGTLSSVSGKCVRSEITKSNFKEQPPAKRLKTGKDCNHDNINRSKADINKNKTDQMEIEILSPDKSESSIHYSDLKKLAHHCPVAFSQFKNYTNIMELVSSRCTGIYGNCKDRLPYWAKKIYLIFYLYPEYRLSDSLIKQIKILPNCPESLKSKIVEIPVIEEKNEDNKINNAHIPEDNNNNNDDNCAESAHIHKPVTSISDVTSTHMEISTPADANLKKSAYNDAREISPVICSKDLFALGLNSIKDGELCSQVATNKTTGGNSSNTDREQRENDITKKCSGEIGIESNDISVTTETTEIPNVMSHIESQISERSVSNCLQPAQSASCYVKDGFNDNFERFISEPGVKRVTHSENSDHEPTHTKSGISPKQNNVAPTDNDRNVKDHQPPVTPIEYVGKQLDDKGNLPPAKAASSIHYSDLKKFAHHCPVTFSQFKKYTNIMELVSRSCTRKYSNPKDHLLYWAKKIYLIYYLYPEYRLSESLIKQIKILPNCPEALKSKIVEIPVIEEKIGGNEINDGQVDDHDPEDNNNSNKSAKIEISMKEPITTNSDILSEPTGMSTKSGVPLKESDLVGGHTNSKKIPSRGNSNNNDCEMGTVKPLPLRPAIVQNNYVEILEDRLLANVPKEIMCLQLHTKNPSCKFCQVSLEEFIAKSNVKYVMENMGVNDEGAIREMYIRFMQLDENIAKMLVVSGALMLTIFKCPTICGDCERKWILSRPQAQAIEEMLTPGPRVLEEKLQTLANDDVDNESYNEIQTLCKVDGSFKTNHKSGDGGQFSKPNESGSSVNKHKEGAGSVCNANNESHLTSEDSQVPGRAVAATVVDDTNSKEAFQSAKEVEKSSKSPNTKRINSENALKVISANNEWFSEFSHMLLDALREPFDFNLFPVSLEEFQQCSIYKEPLKQIICDFCGPAVELVQSFVKNKELYDSLLLYYYRKFFTCPNLRKKYPLKLKICPASLREKMLSFMEATAATGIQVMQKSSGENRQQTVDANIIVERGSVNKDNAPERQSEPCRNIFKSPQNCVKLLAATSGNKSQISLKGPSRRASVGSPLRKEHTSSLQKEATPLLPSPRNQSEVATVNSITNSNTQLNPNSQTSAFTENRDKATTARNPDGKEDVPETSACNNIKDKIIDADLACLERMKDIFNGPDYRTHTLAYILRTSFGLKQRIVQTVLNFSLQQFKSITHIYEGQQSYQDDRLVKYIYDCVCKGSVWPINLYINLEDLLFKLMQSELICEKTPEPSAMLAHISPKFLHWSNLLSSTNFISSVCSDYLHRTGDLLDITNKNVVEAECINYYNRCWIHEQWIGQIPQINENILTTLCDNKTGANIISTSDVSVHKVSLQPLIEESAEQIHIGERNSTIEDTEVCVHEDTTQGKCADAENSEEIICSKLVNETADFNNTDAISLNATKDNAATCDDLPVQEVLPQSLMRAANYNIQEEILPKTATDCLENVGKLVEKIDIDEQWDGSLNDTNYINIQNTQDQIGTLPPETIVPDIIDPLEENCTKSIGGCSIDGDEIITIDDVDVTIKMEFDSMKPLRCLKFLEDSDGNIECIPAADEVIDLDSSPQFNPNDEEENLPSSQIDFDGDEMNANHLNLPAKSAQKCSGDLISSGSSGSIFNLGQRLPSYCYSSETPYESQQGNSGSMNIDLELPDVSLLNRGGSVESKSFLIQQNLENIVETSATIANIHPAHSNVECIRMIPEARRPPSTFADTLPTASKYTAPMVRICSEIANTDGTIKSITKGKKLDTKTTKGDIVPQRTHVIRPLPLDIRGPSSTTSEAHPVAITIDKNKPRRRSSRIASVTVLEPTITCVQTKSVPQDLQQTTTSAVTAIDNVPHKSKLRRRSSRLTQDTNTNIDNSNEFVPAVTSSQTTSTFQPEEITHVRSSQRVATLHPEALRVSQELLKDCTIFNNTSLLRAADQMSATTTSTAGKFDKGLLDKNITVFNKTSLLRAADQNCINPAEMKSKSPKKPLKAKSRSDRDEQT